jgi:tetratricopeptide (TPR) repeat protein
MPNRRSVRSILLVFAITLAWLVLSPPSLLSQASSPGSESSSFESLASQATAAREQGKPDDAIRYYQQALQIHPEWEEGWWYVGTLLYDGNHFSEAQPAFAKVVELDPKMGPAWSFLGLCAFETKDYPAALANLEKGHELGSAQVPEIAKVADYHLALLQIRTGDFDAAMKLLSSEFVHGQVADQVKIALGLALLRVPLLAEEVDPSKDAVVATAGGIAVLLAQEQRPEALKLLQQAITDYPDIPNFRAAYAAITQPATPAAQQPDANELAQTARLFARNASAAKSDPGLSAGSSSTNFDDLAKKAVAERDAGNTDAAIRDYQGALQLRPTWEDGWWDLSLVFFSNSRYPEAIGSLKHVVDLKPGFGTAWAMLGLSEYENRDYKNSLIHLSKAQGLGIQGSPEAIRIAQYHLAVLLNQSGEFERAVDLLAAGHAEGPLATQWNMALGMGLLRVPLLPEQVNASQQPMLVSAGEVASLLANSKYDDAFVVLQKLLKEYPNTPFIHYAYGSALASLSQYDEAEAQLRAEIRISPDSALPYIRIAFIALKTQRPGDALTAAQHAVQLAPQLAEAHYILGRALLGSGDTQQAIHELETANGMMPNSPEIHFHLARAYSKAKQPEKAEQEREIFARLNTVAEQQRSTRGSQAYGASHDQSDLSLPAAAPPVDRATQQ